MKKLFTFINNIAIIVLCVHSSSFASCNLNDSNSFPNPKFEAGMAKISGKLIGFERPEGGGKLVVELGFGNVVTGEKAHYETDLKDDNSFAFEVPVDRDLLCVWVTVSNDKSYYASILTTLSTHRETTIEIMYDKNGKTVSMQGYANMTDADMIHSYDIMGRLLVGGNVERGVMDEFEYMIAIMDENVQIVHNDSLLSQPVKQCIEYEFRLLYGHLMWEWAQRMDKLDIYYKFLRYLNLNDPQYLSMGNYYIATFQDLLQTDALAIPSIGETPVAEWLAEVKATLADVVGFSEGQFYDLLVSNAYGRQFEMESRSLSEKQIANINDYFSDDKAAFAEILLRHNTEIEKLAAGVSELVINETPDVPNEQLLDAIIAKHKGKVVVIDFWATWCAPCLQAMKQIREMKSEFNPDGVAYVYLTGSSPEELWHEMIPGIGGIHYRLSEEQWVYLMEQFDFEGIPSYAIIDSEGNVHDSFTGYPGNDRMKKIIKGLLP